MANGKEFADAVQLAREHPGLDIGVHLVLIGGASLLPGGRAMPATVSELTWAVFGKRLRPYEELKAQVERILAVGLRPTHLDTHKHTHLLPAVLEAVARLSQEFRIPWVRRPFDYPLSGAGMPWPQRATSRTLSVLRRQFHEKLAAYGCRTTDHFAGFQLTGRFRSQELVQLFENLPEGSTEFMCHPGFCTDELRSMPTRLKESREMELSALIDPKVREALQLRGIHLTTFHGD